MSENKSIYEEKFQGELKRLNAEQRKAVEHIDGPVMVIAGPGTGKTQILAGRIGYILKSDLQIAPHNILCLTYTEAGTVAMRNRLIEFIGPTAYRVNIHTFHSFCNDIIQHNLDYFGKRELELISELENIQLIQEILNSLDANHPLKRLKGDIYFDVPRINDLFRIMKEEDWAPQYISLQIDKYITDLPNRDEYVYKRSNSKAGIKAGDIKEKEIDKQKEKMELLRAASNLFTTYCAKMHERNRYDYSDMILWVLNAFKNDKDFLQIYQEWYQSFLVDEFQDTSGSQNEILQLLIDYWNKPNVFVVGDDDQCIYEFQGARVKNMTNFFEKYEKDIEIIILKENYRSSQDILNASKAVIDNNTQRLVNQPPLLRKIPNLSKELVSAIDKLAQKDLQPTLIEFHNILHEEIAIVESIKILKHKNIPLNEVAIIFAKHNQGANIINLLEKKEITYSVKKKINILHLPLVQQILNILTYIQSEYQKPNSGEHLLYELMHYKYFNIHPTDAAQISIYCGKNYLQWREMLADYESLKKLNLKNYGSIIFFEKNINRWISEIPNLTLPLLFEKVLNWGNILKHILHSPERMWLLQVVTTLFDFIKSETSKHPLLTIKSLLFMIEQMREEKISIPINKTVFEENGVNLMSAHSAKGLEYKYVFMIGCTADKWEKSHGNTSKFTLPDTLTYSKKDEENKRESSRRLFFVGMTRAKEYLQISYAATSNEGKPLEHTEFIENILSSGRIKIEKKHLSQEKIAEYSTLALTERNSDPLNLMKEEFIKTALENYSLSATHLNKYLSCPVAFYYENILRVPSAKNENAAFGTSVHNTLKWFFDEVDKTGTFPSKEELLKVFEKFILRQRDSFTEEQFKRRIELSNKLFPEYYDRYINSWNKIVITEFKIDNVECDGIPIKGTLDKIEFNGNECNVVDYKTGNPKNGIKKFTPPSADNPSGGDYWRQLVFYKILMDNLKRKEWEMISGEIDFIEPEEIKGNDFIKLKMNFSNDDIDFVKKQIQEVYHKIMNHEFKKGCGKTRGTVKEREECTWCNFAHAYTTPNELCSSGLTEGEH